MKLHESDNRGGITVKTYKEHLLIYIYLALGFGSEIPTWSCWREAFIIIDRFYIAILRSRADSLRSHVILHEWIAWSFWCEAVEAKLLKRSCWRETTDVKLLHKLLHKSSGTSHSENGEADQSVRVLAERRIVHGCSHFLSRGWSWYVSLSLSLSLSIFLCLSLWLSVSLSVCLCVSLSLSVSGFLISWSGSVSSPSFDNPAAILQTTAQLLVRLPVCLMLKSVFMVWASFNCRYCRYCTATFHSTAAWTGWVAVVTILLFGTVF